jgi:hypothetical protein
MFNLILGVLEQGLNLWNSKESTKYMDRLIRLKKDFHEEYNKPLDERSDIRLDDIEFELRVLAESFIQTTKSPDPKIK